MKVASKFFGCVLALMLSVGVAFGQDRVVPEQKIVGAEKAVPLGEIVFLSLSKVETPPAGYVKFHVAWKVMDGGKEKPFRTMPDGSIFFGSGVSKRMITVYACVSYLYEERKDNQLVSADVRSALITTQVQIGDGVIPPPPNPDNPDPVFPDGKYKLSASVYKVAKEKVAAEDRPAASALAKSFRAKAQDIKDGKHTKIEDILSETTKSNRDALDKAGVARAKWDVFFSTLQEDIYKLYQDKKLVTPADFTTAWIEIADGLDKVPQIAAKKE
jgi:hypothetical protein